MIRVKLRGSSIAPTPTGPSFASEQLKKELNDNAIYLQNRKEELKVRQAELDTMMKSKTNIILSESK